AVRLREHRPPGAANGDASRRPVEQAFVEEDGQRPPGHLAGQPLKLREEHKEVCLLVVAADLLRLQRPREGDAATGAGQEGLATALSFHPLVAQALKIGGRRVSLDQTQWGRSLAIPPRISLCHPKTRPART